jgi:TolB protein
MGADGSNPRIVTPFGEGVEFNAPEWSPVDGKVALWGASRGTFQLMTLDAERPGSQITQLTSAGDNEDPSWAPDGRHIVYSGSGAGRDGLYVIDTVTGNVRLLVQGRSLRTGDWSPSLAGLVSTN